MIIMRKIFILSMTLFMLLCSCRNQSEKSINMPVADKFYQLSPGAVSINGFLDDKLMQQVDIRIKQQNFTDLVDFFRYRDNEFAAGEFWGKAVRGAAFNYRYTQDRELYKLLENTVADLLGTQTEDGCISSFSYDEQPYSADLWCRKYVLLGLQAYYEHVDQDPGVIDAMIKLMDYTISQIGPSPKVRIINTGWAFEGIESSSIIEPVVNLYKLTGYERYLDFASYIVEQEGGCKRENIFEAAFQGKDVKDFGSNGNPHESISKQYEMLSCFEGLMEFYRATGNTHWKEAELNFYKNVLETETAIIGTGGGLGSHNLGPAPTEQWNGSTCAQIHPDRGGLETCGTVTWMKYCQQLLRLTGNPLIADEIERTMYNALLGSIKPDGSWIDYHSQLTGTRNTKVNYLVSVGDEELSCCVFNVPYATAMIPFTAVMNSPTGPVINLYIPGTMHVPLQGGREVVLKTSTGFPVSDSVQINVELKRAESFTLRIRIPAWSEKTTLKVNGEDVMIKPGSFAGITRKWKQGDQILLVLDQRCRLVKPPCTHNPAEEHFQALMRGPIVLARDKRLKEDIHEAMSINVNNDGTVDAKLMPPTIGTLLELEIPTKDGGSFHVVDYASAGSTWDADSEFRTWIPQINPNTAQK